MSHIMYTRVHYQCLNQLKMQKSPPALKNLPKVICLLWQESLSTSLTSLLGRTASDETFHSKNNQVKTILIQSNFSDLQEQIYTYIQLFTIWFNVCVFDIELSGILHFLQLQILAIVLPVTFSLSSHDGCLGKNLKTGWKWRAASKKHSFKTIG